MTSMTIRIPNLFVTPKYEKIHHKGSILRENSKFLTMGGATSSELGFPLTTTVKQT